MATVLGNWLAFESPEMEQGFTKYANRVKMWNSVMVGPREARGLPRPVLPMMYYFTLNFLTALLSVSERGAFTGEVYEPTIWFVPCVILALFLTVCTFCVVAMRVLHGQHQDSWWANDSVGMSVFERGVLFVYTSSVLCYTLDLNVRISIAYPHLCETIFPNNPLVNFQLPAMLAATGQLTMMLIGTAVHHATFNPLFRRASALACVQGVMFLVHVVFATDGLQHSVGACMALFMIGLAGEACMLSSVYTLERAQRLLFVESRGLEQKLEQEQQAQSLRNAIAHERGRAQAERTIVAYLCHEV
jgi:hypothetical protein